MPSARCRRCNAELEQDESYCGICGTHQRRVPPWVHDPTARVEAGWHRDPFGRWPYRFFDGAVWTAQVYGEAQGHDPVAIDLADVGRPAVGAWSASIGSLTLSLTGLLLAFGTSFLFVLPYLLLGHPGGVVVALLLSEIGLWSGLVGTCVLTSHRYGTGSLRVDFRLRFRPIDLPIGLGSSIVARSVATFVLLPFLHELERAGNPDKSLYAATGLGAAGWIALVVVTCLGAPLFEELFFRGLLMGQLSERFGPTLGIIISAVLFGAAHIANDPGIAGLLLALSVGAAGLVLGYVRYLTRRLGSSMATHAFFNAAAMVALALGAR